MEAYTVQETLKWDCSCGNQYLNISNFVNTMPYFVCQQWRSDCVAAHSNNASAQNDCLLVTCGSLEITDTDATTSKSAQSSSKTQTTSKKKKTMTTSTAKSHSNTRAAAQGSKTSEPGHTHTSEGLSSGAKAGIGVGVGVGGVVVLAALFFLFYNSWKKRSTLRPAGSGMAERRSDGLFGMFRKSELSGEPARAELDAAPQNPPTELDSRAKYAELDTEERPTELVASGESPVK